MPNLDLDLQKILDQTSFNSTITGMVELNGVLYFTVNSSISPSTAKVGLWKFENGIYSAIEHTLVSNKFSFPIIFNNQIYFSVSPLSGTGDSIVRYDPIANQFNTVVSSGTIGIAIYSLCVFNNYLYVSHYHSSNTFKIGRISNLNVYANVYSTANTNEKYCNPRSLVVFNNEIYHQRVYAYISSIFMKSVDGLTWNNVRDYSFPFITGQEAYLEVIGSKVYTRDSDNIYSTSDFINWTRVSSNSFLTEEIGEFDNKYFLVKNTLPREILTSSNLNIPSQIEEVSPTTVTVGNNPYSIIFAGSYLWAINNGPNNVSKIDITTNTVVATITVGSNPQYSAFDGTHIWVTNNAGSSVSKVDIVTNTVIATVTVGSSPKGIVFAENHIWVVNSGSNNVSKINISTNTVVATITVGTSARHAAFDGTYIWVTNWGGNIYKINATTNVKTTISFPERVNSIIFDGTNIWASQGEVIGTYYSYLYKYNISTNAIISSKVIPGSYGMASLGDYIWIASYQTNTVIKVDKNTLSIILTLEVGTSPYGIASNGSDLWTANYNSMNVSKIIGTLNSPPEQTWETVYTFGDNLSYTSKFKQFGNYLYLGINATNQIYPRIYRSAGLNKIYRTFTEDFNLSEILNVGYRFINSEILDIQSGVKTTRDIIAKVIDYINLESLIYHRKNIYQILNSLFVNISDFAQRNLDFRKILNNDINLESTINHLKKITQNIIDEIWIDSLSHTKLYLKRILDFQIAIYSDIKSKAIYKRILESFINISEELINKAIYKRILEEQISIISGSYFLRKTKEIVLDIVNVVSDIFHKKEIKYQFESNVEISTNIKRKGFLKRILENFIDISTGEQRNIIFKRILDSAIEVASIPLFLITKLSIVNEDFWIDSQVLTKGSLKRILNTVIEIYSQKIKLIDYIKILSNDINISSINPIPHISKTLQETLNIISEVIASRKLLGILFDIINLETNFISSRNLVRITNKTIDIYESLKLATFKTYSEGVNITSDIFYLNTLRRFLNEIIEIPTIIVQKVRWIKIFQENIEISSLTDRFLTFKRLLNEKVEIWKIVLRRTGLRRFLDEPINIVSGVIDRRHLPKIVQDILNISTNVGYVKSLFERLNEQVSINTQEISFKIYKRILETFENISETVIEVFSGYIIKNIPESMNLNEGLISKAIYKRILDESIDIVENLPNSIFKLVRILNNYLDITEKIQIPIKLVLSEIVNLVDSALNLNWYISKYLQMLVGCDSTDLSSYENALTFYGNVYSDYSDSPIEDGCSLVFGGCSDYIRANSGNWIDFSLQTWSIGFWVKPTTYSDDANIFYVGDSLSDHFKIVLTTSGKIVVSWVVSYVENLHLESSTAILLDEWTYVEVTQIMDSIYISIGGIPDVVEIQNSVFGPYSGDAIIGKCLKGKLYGFFVYNSLEREDITAESPDNLAIDDISIFILDSPDKSGDKNEYEAIKEGVVIASPTMTLAQTEGAEVFPIEDDEINLPEVKDNEIKLGQPQKSTGNKSLSSYTSKGGYVSSTGGYTSGIVNYISSSVNFSTGSGGFSGRMGQKNNQSKRSKYRMYYAEMNTDYWRIMYVDTDLTSADYPPPPNNSNVSGSPVSLNIGTSSSDQAKSPFVFYDSKSSYCYLYYSVLRSGEISPLAYRKASTSGKLPDETNLSNEVLLKDIEGEVGLIDIENAFCPNIQRKSDQMCRLYYIWNENTVVYHDVLKVENTNPPELDNFLSSTIIDSEYFDELETSFFLDSFFILPYKSGIYTYYRIYEYYKDSSGIYFSSYRNTLNSDEMPELDGSNLSARVSVSFSCNKLFILKMLNGKYRIYYLSSKEYVKRKIGDGSEKGMYVHKFKYRDTKDTSIPMSSNLESQEYDFPIEFFTDNEFPFLDIQILSTGIYRCYYFSVDLSSLESSDSILNKARIYYTDTINENTPGSSNIVDPNTTWSNYKLLPLHDSKLVRESFKIILLDSGKYRIYFSTTDAGKNIYYVDTIDEYLPGIYNLDSPVLDGSRIAELSDITNMVNISKIQILKHLVNNKYRVYAKANIKKWNIPLQKYQTFTPFIHRETEDVPDYNVITENSKISDKISISIRNQANTANLNVDKFSIYKLNTGYYRIYVSYEGVIGYVDSTTQELPDENNVSGIPITPLSGTISVPGDISDFFFLTYPYNTNTTKGHILFTHESGGIKKLAYNTTTKDYPTSVSVAANSFLNLVSSISKWQESPCLRNYLTYGTSNSQIIFYSDNEGVASTANTTAFPTVNKIIEVLG